MSGSNFQTARLAVAPCVMAAALCLLTALPVLAQQPPPAPVLQLTPASQQATVLRGGTLWTATGAVLQDTDILLQHGKIAAVAKGIALPAGGREIDVRGRILTPGLVDMHSHLGVYGAPNAKAHADGNEMTGPTTPAVRALDGFDPEDPAIARAVAGGVTTSLILPGSGNAVGGQALYVKLRGHSVAEMALPKPPRSMKWAMGENPKRVYGGRSQLPMSRMGHAWVLRRMLFEARDLRDQQDAWERNPLHTGVRPFRADMEPIVALLRGEVYLQVHCYEVHDIETLLRISDEFGFRVAALHHALEAWKIPRLLVDHHVGVATFADLWGFKMEAYDGSVHSPKVLYDAGVLLALTSDHPVIDAHYLMFEAAKAHHYGLPEQAALQAVTRNPARLIGISDRLGTLEAGKDADVIVWPSSPLELGVRPERVFIDGEQIVGTPIARPANQAADTGALQRVPGGRP